MNLTSIEMQLLADALEHAGITSDDPEENRILADLQRRLEQGAKAAFDRDVSFQFASGKR